MNKITKITTCLGAIILLGSCGNSNEIGDVELIPVKSGKDYQYIDKEGKIVINPQFSEATVFRNGLALVKSSGENPKWGFIDDKGTLVIPSNYVDATVFSEDLAWVVAENGAPTAINSKGEIKITLQNAETVNLFKEGLAAYSVSDSIGEKWGFVDKEGKVKINPQFFATGNFSDGKCAIVNADNKCGYIDKEGKIIINPQFDEGYDFENGTAVVKVEGKAGLIDEVGKYIINPQYSNILNDGKNFLIEKDGKWGWCDKEGKVSINPQFENAYPFKSNELAAVQSGKSWCYIDKDGKIVITPQFDYAMPFNGKLALVTSSSKIGFIAVDGKYVINPQYDAVSADLIKYMQTGGSRYESVTTQYFNISAITARIQKDVTDKTIAGLNFTSLGSKIMTQFKLTEKDFSQYDNENKVITDEKISNDASLNFYVIAKAFNGDSYSGRSFNPEFNPLGFVYIINLNGKAVLKQKEILKAFETSFTGFTKIADQSNETTLVLKSSVFLMQISASSGISIKITPVNQEVAVDEYAGE